MSYASAHVTAFLKYAKAHVTAPVTEGFDLAFVGNSKQTRQN